MKKIRYIIFGLVVFTLSCSEDFVDLTNPNQITTGSFWKTEEDAVAGVNACYQTLLYDGLYMRLFPWVMDVRSDDCRNTSPWWTTDLVQYILNPDNPCYIATWEHCYTGIYRTNQVLEFVPEIEDLDENLEKRLIAEAKFLRGFFYYHLVVAYKNVPLITTLPSGIEDYFPAQAEPADVWQQVISDFSDAIPDLPRKGEYSDDDIGRATMGAAAGYLAKAYMFTRQWDEAEPILSGIINGDYGNYTLIADYRQNFTEETENNDESLFEVQFNRDVGGTLLGWDGDPLADWSKTSGKARTYAPLGGYGYGDITPTDWIFYEFLEERTTDGLLDPRMKASMFFEITSWEDDVPDVAGFDTTYFVYNTPWRIAKNQLPNFCHIRKYLNDGSTESAGNPYNDEVEWRSGINERVLRYADILLLYAECLNELNRTGEAYPFIQIVRDRANLPDLADVKPGMGQAEMREQIYHERALEFCFEAIRYQDITRWGWFDEPARVDTLISHDPEFALWTEGREILAIPPDDIDANGNLLQNPGWTN